MKAEKDSIGEWYRNVPLSAKWPIFTGLAILVVWLGCFGVWAGVAPLNSAVVAPGTFVATGQNKLVQHFEGGIIREIAVKDGDAVEANQVLVRMDDTAADTKLRRLVIKKYRQLAMKARLEAEMSSSDTIETPAAFSETARDPEIKAIFERHRPARRHAGLVSRPRKAYSGSKSQGWRKAFADIRRKCSPPKIVLPCSSKS